MLTQLTNALTMFITNLYATTGLAGILLAMAIESCCIPLPSELVMPLAGVMLFQGHILPGVNPVLGLLLIALAGSLGCLLGSTVAYWIGYAGGRPLLLKYGRYVLISQHDADRADAFFQRWGSATAFFSRLLPVVRTYISLPAGIARMPFVKFSVFTLLGSFPWCLLLAFAGYKIGQNLSTLGSVFHGLDIVILLVVVILVVLYIWRHIRNDRQARAAHAAAESAAQVSQQNGWAQPQQSQQQMQQPWGQQPAQPGWGQQSPQQQGWGQPPGQQSGQQSGQQAGQAGWGRQPGWGQPPAPVPPMQQPQPGWGQPPQQGWPSPRSDSENAQRR